MDELPVDFLDSLADLNDGELAIERSLASIPTIKADKATNAKSIKEVLELVAMIEKQQQERGTLKWFESPYGIDTLPKHAAFFSASAKYNEVCFLAANR